SSLFTLHLGVPAERVAGDSVDELLRNVESGGCVDEHLQDQLIIFMALAAGKSRASFTVTPCGTDNSPETFLIECDGIGLINENIFE
ncbi:putative RNA 3'-terminal phosphate cyclase, partial [Exaiptasia diaphana]